MIKKNRRCRNLTHKKYRHFRCDLWGRLALKRRNNFITNLICDFNVLALKRRLRHASPKMRLKLKRFFSPELQTRLARRPAFQINNPSVQRRIRNNSQRGIILRLRRQIALYYSGGKIREKTYRKLSRRIRPEKKKIHKTVGAVFESRLDALLLRSCFVDSVYRARSLIAANKIKVVGIARATHPGVSLNLYQIFSLRGKEMAIFNHKLRIKIAKFKQFLMIPSYLFFDVFKMRCFLIEAPLTHLVGYHFAEDLGALGYFRKSYRML